MAVFISDQFHHQHAVEVAMRLRHTHPGGSEFVQRVDFGVLPRLFGFLAPELAGLADRARLPATTHLAPFLILHARLETTLTEILVHLGATNLVAATHDVYGRFLATFQRPEHLINHAFLNQFLQALGGLHASDNFNNSWNTAHYGRLTAYVDAHGRRSVQSAATC